MERIWYRAAKCFCSLWATQNLSISPSLMLQLIYLHRFYLLWCHYVRGVKSCCCCICSFPSHFTQIRGPRTTRPSCHFLGLYENASSFSKQTKKKREKKKNVRSFAFRRVRADPPHYHILSRGENKRHDHFQKKNVINISYCVQQHRRRMRWGGSRMWDHVSRGREVFLSPGLGLTPLAKYNQHVGLFRLFSEAAWWRSSCLIHRWP